MNKTILFLLVVGLFFVSCKDEETTPEDTSPTLTLKKDGVDVSLISKSIVLTRNEILPPFSTVMTINYTSNKGTLSVAIVNWEMQNPPENGILVKEYGVLRNDVSSDCKVYQNTTYCDGAFLEYIEGQSGYYSEFDGVDFGTVVITAIDTEKKTISGHFETEVYKADTSGDKITFKSNFKNFTYFTL